VSSFQKERKKEIKLFYKKEMLTVGDFFVFNDYQEKSPIYKILALGNENEKWSVRNIENGQIIEFNPHGQEKNIIKIKHITSINYIGERDPWDFYFKLSECHENDDHKNLINKIIENRDYEIMNWTLFNYGTDIIQQDVIDEIVKKGDLLMIDLLKNHNLIPSQECLTWAIESNLTKIMVKLMFIGVEPDIRAVNWACINLPATSVELIMIAGFFPDSAGVAHLKNSGDLHKQTLVDIFELR